MNIIIFIFAFFININIYSSYYILYPNVDSGNNFSQYIYSYGFQDYFSFDKRMFLDFSFLASFNNNFDYGFLAYYSNYPYGVFSFSFMQKDVDQVFKLPQQDFFYEHKESAFNLTYQNGIRAFLFQLGFNIFDPIYLNDFSMGGDLLFSVNLGFQIHFDNYFLFEFATLNLFKRSSDIVLDFGERFFSAIDFRLFRDFAIRVSMHYFKDLRMFVDFSFFYRFFDRLYFLSFLSYDSFSFGLSFDFIYFLTRLYFGFMDSDFFVGLFIRFNILSSFSGGDYSDSFLLNSQVLNYYYVNKVKIIDINTADKQDFMTLPRVGIKIAERILRYREKRLFYRKEDIMFVRGIGPGIFARIKEFITVGNIDIQKRFCHLDNWTMKNFVDIGILPSLSFDIVMFIRYGLEYNKLEDLRYLDFVDDDVIKVIYDKLAGYKCF